MTGGKGVLSRMYIHTRREMQRDLRLYAHPEQTCYPSPDLQGSNRQESMPHTLNWYEERVFIKFLTSLPSKCSPFLPNCTSEENVFGRLVWPASASLTLRHKKEWVRHNQVLSKNVSSALCLAKEMGEVAVSCTPKRLRRRVGGRG